MNAQQADKHWPIIRVSIPGKNDILVRGLPVAGTPDQPWSVNIKGSTASINPGTVAGIVPSNMFNTYQIGGFGVIYYWKCEVQTDGKQITSAEIKVDENPPSSQTLVPSALPVSAEFAFAISKGKNVYRTIGPGNPSVVFNQAVITDKEDPPPPGVPGVDRWYNILFF